MPIGREVNDSEATMPKNDGMRSIAPLARIVRTATFLRLVHRRNRALCAFLFAFVGSNNTAYPAHIT